MLLLLRGSLQAVKRRQVHPWTNLRPQTRLSADVKRGVWRCGVERTQPRRGSAGSGSGTRVLAGDVITVFHRDVQTVTVAYQLPVQLALMMQHRGICTGPCGPGGLGFRIFCFFHNFKVVHMVKGGLNYHF